MGARGLKGGQDARGAQRVPRARMHLYRIVCIVRARWSRRVALPVPALMVDFPSDFPARMAVATRARSGQSRARRVE